MLDTSQLDDSAAPRRQDDPVKSALTGKSVSPGDVRIRLSDRYAVWIRAGEKRGLSDEELTLMIEQWRGDLPVDEAVPPSVAYDDMPMVELRRRASERGIDTKGARTTEDVANRLRVADVAERFGNAPTADVTAEEGENG
jgi:hypothetical protein